MKKTFALSVLSLTIAALLCGCYPTGQNSVDKTDSSYESLFSQPSQSSQQETQLPNNFIFDMELPDDIPSEIPAIKLKQKIWNNEEIENLFLSDKQIEEKEEHDSGIFPGEKFYRWKTKDQLAIVVEPGRFLYADYAELNGKYQYGTVIAYASGDCKLIDDCFATNEDLSMFSCKDAEKRMEEMFGKLGIANFGNPRVIAVHCGLANKVLSGMEGNPNKDEMPIEYTPWTENEEIYILRYPLVYENKELAMSSVTYPYSDKSSGSVTRDPGIIAVVSKDKILSVDAITIFSESYETTEKLPVNCDAKKAFGKLKEYLSNLVEDNLTKYYSCKPVYIPYSGTSDNMTIIFKTAWEFAGYSEHKFSEFSSPEDLFLNRGQLYEYFWADTGNRYIEARD